MIDETGKLWKGDAFHAGGWEGEPTYERGLKVADIIRYETEQLGNVLHISPELMAKYGDKPARIAIWVTRTREEAEEYGEPEEAYIPQGSFILAQDNYGGYLVVRPAMIKNPDAPEGFNQLQLIVTKENYDFIVNKSIPLIRGLGGDVLAFDPNTLKFTVKYNSSVFLIGHEIMDLSELRGFFKNIDKVKETIKFYLDMGRDDYFFSNIYRTIKSTFGKRKGRTLAYFAVLDAIRGAGKRVVSNNPLCDLPFTKMMWWRNPEGEFREMLIQLDMCLTGCDRVQAEETANAQQEKTLRPINWLTGMWSEYIDYTMSDGYTTFGYNPNLMKLNLNSGSDVSYPMWRTTECQLIVERIARFLEKAAGMPVRTIGVYANNPEDDDDWLPKYPKFEEGDPCFIKTGFGYTEYGVYQSFKRATEPVPCTFLKRYPGGKVYLTLPSGHTGVTVIDALEPRAKNPEEIHEYDGFVWYGKWPYPWKLGKKYSFKHKGKVLRGIVRAIREDDIVEMLVVPDLRIEFVRPKDIIV